MLTLRKDREKARINYGQPTHEIFSDFVVWNCEANVWSESIIVHEVGEWVRKNNCAS